MSQHGWRQEIGTRWPDLDLSDTNESAGSTSLRAILAVIRSGTRGQAQADTRVNELLQEECQELRVDHTMMTYVADSTRSQAQYQADTDRDDFPVSTDSLFERADDIDAQAQTAWDEGRREVAQVVVELVEDGQRLYPSTVHELAEIDGEDALMSDELARAGTSIETLLVAAERTPGYVGADERRAIRQAASSGVDFSRGGDDQGWSMPSRDEPQMDVADPQNDQRGVEQDGAIYGEPEQIGRVVRRVSDQMRRRDQDIQRTTGSEPEMG